MRFLSVDGRWVADREDAQDFHSLLPAYYFARDNTSRHFQVVLYCPEDHFCASIIAGKGIATPDSNHTGAQPVAVRIISKRGRTQTKVCKASHSKNPLDQRRVSAGGVLTRRVGI